MHGHQDLDGDSLSVYAPTPPSESSMAVLQIIAAMKWRLQVADAKNAFRLSKKLQRPNGAIFVEPCQRLEIGSERPIELIAPVYGLNDVPLLWHRTLTEWLPAKDSRRACSSPVCGLSAVRSVA